MPARPAHSRGFTLIELILVLVLISITLALAAPSLRGWGQGQKLRNASDSFHAATGYARGMAVTHARPYAIEIDAAAFTFVVKSIGPDGVRAAADGDMGEPAVLPTAFTIRLVKGGDAGAGGAADGSGVAAAGVPSIVFYPDTRATPAVVEIKSPGGEVASLASDSPAEPFRRVEATP